MLQVSCIYKVIYAAFLWLFLLPQYNYALTISSQASGNWSNANTWAGGVMPANNDDVIISTGNTVNLNFSLPSTSSFLSLTIQPGAALIVTVNSSTLRIKGNLMNNGILNLWQANNLQADIILYDNSVWSGNGFWNLSGLNIQGNSIEFSSGLILNVNGSISAGANGSFNKLNKHSTISLVFNGTANSTIPSLAANFYYGNITVNKVSGNLSFLPSASDNDLNFSGDLDLVNTNDRLIINDFNTLKIHKSVSGSGEISGGGITSSIVIDNVTATAINPLRVSSGVSFKNFIVNRSAGVVLASGFTVRELLALNNQSRLTLSNQTLSLGANASPPAPGIFSGDGYLVGSAASSISVRGNNPNPTYLRFSQMSSQEYTLNNMIVDKISGITGLFNDCNLNITGFMDVYNDNSYSIGKATLTFNSVPHFLGNGSLKGSEQSSLVIAGNGTASYSLQFDQSTSSGRSLQYYIQSRNAIIELSNKLEIVGTVNLTGNSSRLISNGNLTLLSSAERNAGIAALNNSTDIIGDVNVQLFLTGGEGMRGTRTLSSPVTADALLPVFKQLQSYMFITGSGTGGFDNPGSAPSLFKYIESSSIQDGASAQYTAVTNLNSSPLPAEGFFLNFRGDRLNNLANKLNPPYAIPESFPITYTGPINKGVVYIPATVLTYTNRTEHFGDAAYNGYHLIGNPYPATINWETVVKTNMENIVSIIKPGGGMITYSNGFVTNGGPPYSNTESNEVVSSGLPLIQTGQGFYVKAKPGGGTITFTENCKNLIALPARLLYDGRKLLLKKSSQNDFENKSTKFNIKVELENNKNSEQTIVVFADGLEAKYGEGDASYFSGSSISLASITEDMHDVAINFMPDLSMVQEVRLKVDAASSGTVKFNFTELNIPDNFNLLLKDEYLKALVPLIKGLVYQFEIDKAISSTFGISRFSLIINKKKENVNPEIAVYPNPVRDLINVKMLSKKVPIPQLNIYDILGVKKLSTIGFQQDVSNLTSGIYLIEITDLEKKKSLGRFKFLKE
ncbi:T9SS type A sorting domain-containing protein [Daejeonella oryzae]|uniref:T9SS type A sorting domain-containing protein n=1 Tax=Daejeonella oryzae TaxID=1122943 RepID=UPI0005689925|nr:T9SS type A sorting domain-containing protein [Daejeonella oryzae]